MRDESLTDVSAYHSNGLLRQARLCFGELYDLQEDPHEFVNLADSPSHVAIKDRLIAEFREWQKATDDPFAERTTSDRSRVHS